jgi:hypothetical protein
VSRVNDLTRIMASPAAASGQIRFALITTPEAWMVVADFKKALEISEEQDRYKPSVRVEQTLHSGSQFLGSSPAGSRENGLSGRSRT